MHFGAGAGALCHLPVRCSRHLALGFSLISWLLIAVLDKHQLMDVLNCQEIKEHLQNTDIVLRSKHHTSPQSMVYKCSYLRPD